MKTPDEIKKGLERCKNGADCDDCIGSYHCQAEADALAYIQQLEEALLLMVYQYCQEDDSYVSHRYMVAGEHAFAALGIDNYCSIDTIKKRLDEMEALHKTSLSEPPKE